MTAHRDSSDWKRKAGRGSHHGFSLQNWRQQCLTDCESAADEKPCTNQATTVEVQLKPHWKSPSVTSFFLAVLVLFPISRRRPAKVHAAVTWHFLLAGRRSGTAVTVQDGIKLSTAWQWPYLAISYNRPLLELSLQALTVNNNKNQYNLISDCMIVCYRFREQRSRVASWDWAAMLQAVTIQCVDSERK